MRRWLPQIPASTQNTTYRIMAIDWAITPCLPLHAWLPGAAGPRPASMGKGLKPIPVKDSVAVAPLLDVPRVAGVG